MVRNHLSLIWILHCNVWCILLALNSPYNSWTMALLSLFLFCWASAKSNNGCPNLVFVASGKAGRLPDRSSTPWLNAGTQHLCAMNTMILIMILTPNPCCPDTCCQTLRQYHLGVEAVMGTGMVTFAFIFFFGILERYGRGTLSLSKKPFTG